MILSTRYILSISLKPHKLLRLRLLSFLASFVVLLPTNMILMCTFLLLRVHQDRLLYRRRFLGHGFHWLPRQVGFHPHQQHHHRHLSLVLAKNNNHQKNKPKNLQYY
jgi:hypothetical protein